MDKRNAFSQDMMRFRTTRQSRLEALCMSILDLFCSVDTFWKQFAPRWERELLASGQRQRRRA